MISMRLISFVFQTRSSRADFLSSFCILIFPIAQITGSNLLALRCWSWIGRIGGPSIVKLESNVRTNCVDHHTVLHETFHALGLNHEHVRSDRDRFVNVIYKNIRPDCLYNFAKTNNYQTFGLPYDYKSIMHYNMYMCQKQRGEITLSAPWTQLQTMGRAKDASQYDYYKICALYNCQTCMGGPFDLEKVLRRI